MLCKAAQGAVPLERTSRYFELLGKPNFRKGGCLIIYSMCMFCLGQSGNATCLKASLPLFYFFSVGMS